MTTTQPFVVMAKPVGPVCNLECGYCYYLDKSQMFPAGERFKMAPEVLEAYVSSFIAASPGPVVHFGWHGGEPPSRRAPAPVPAGSLELHQQPADERDPARRALVSVSR